MLQHHFSWICTLNFLSIGLFHISVKDFFSEREEWDAFFLAGINSLNKRHISHHEVHSEWCTEKRVTQVFFKPLFNLQFRYFITVS